MLASTQVVIIYDSKRIAVYTADIGHSTVGRTRKVGNVLRNRCHGDVEYLVHINGTARGNDVMEWHRSKLRPFAEPMSHAKL